MTSYRPSYIIVVQEKSDVMNEIMEYVYCLIYIAGIAFCVIRVNNDVKWNIRTVLLIIGYSYINMLVTNNIDVSDIMFLISNMFSTLPVFFVCLCTMQKNKTVESILSIVLYSVVYDLHRNIYVRTYPFIQWSI